MIHNFRELNVWQRSISFAKEIYKTTKLFPQSELYALASQLQRAAVSISANIAEGAGRATDKELCHFLSFSLGSAYEVETELTLSYEFGYLGDDEYKNLQAEIVEIQKMLYALIKRYNY